MPPACSCCSSTRRKVDARDARGRSALHEAAYAGHVDIVAALLAAGADADARDHRRPHAVAGGRARRSLEACSNACSRTCRAAAPMPPPASIADGRNALMLACMAEIAVAHAGAAPARPRRRSPSTATTTASARSIAPPKPDAGRWSPRSIAPTRCRRRSARTASDDAPLPDRAPDRAAARRPARWPRRRTRRPGATAQRRANAARCCTTTRPAALRRSACDWLLAQGADAEVRDAHGDTPVLALLARGADADAVAAGAAAPRRLAGRRRRPGALPRRLRGRANRPGADWNDVALELLERGADPFAPLAGRRPAAGAGGAPGLVATASNACSRSASTSTRATATA